MRIPPEVIAIERDDTANPVDIHRGDEAGIVNLHTLHVVRGNQALPLCVDILRFGENGKEAFEAAPLLARFVRR